MKLEACAAVTALGAMIGLVVTAVLVADAYGGLSQGGIAMTAWLITMTTVIFYGWFRHYLGLE